MTKAKEKPRGEKAPRGRYVYAWFNSDSPFPFYVGKGVADRAWRRHMLKNQSAYCNKMRSASRGFWCHVVRDNLTNEGAMLIEAALVDFFSSMGACEANQVSPMRRQEIPPLWLEAVKQQCERGPGSDAIDDDGRADVLLDAIISVLDETEGQGMLCLTPGKIAERIGVSRDRVVRCMRMNRLNP